MQRFVTRADVLFQELGDETVLLDASAGFYFRLNGTGAFIWAQLSTPSSVADVVTSLAAASDVPESEVAGDVEELITALHDRGLVSRCD